MARPKRKRIVVQPPTIDGFKPLGSPRQDMGDVVLFYEEYEAIRLVDYEQMTHDLASEQMCISRPTFTRIYNKARKSIAQAFVEGRVIVIEGGNFHSEFHWYKCQKCMMPNVSETKQEKCSHCQSKCLRLLNDVKVKENCRFSEVDICNSNMQDFFRKKSKDCYHNLSTNNNKYTETNDDDNHKCCKKQKNSEPQ